MDETHVRQEHMDYIYYTRDIMEGGIQDIRTGG